MGIRPWASSARIRLESATFSVKLNNIISEGSFIIKILILPDTGYLKNTLLFVNI